MSEQFIGMKVSILQSCFRTSRTSVFFFGDKKPNCHKRNELAPSHWVKFKKNMTSNASCATIIAQSGQGSDAGRGRMMGWRQSNLGCAPCYQRLEPDFHFTNVSSLESLAQSRSRV
jgi:hypothetical protein